MEIFLKWINFYTQFRVLLINPRTLPRGVMVAQVVLVHLVEVQILAG